MLPPSQFRFEEGGRLIIVGDIHGMKQSLEYVAVSIHEMRHFDTLDDLPSHLLKKLRFQPHKDKLVHTGDVLVKGPQSLETLGFLTANNVSGQRSSMHFNDQ